MSMDAWPTAELDGIARLRVLAAGLPGVVLVERTLDVSFERLWDFVTDFESSVPQFELDVRSVQVRQREGERLKIRSWASWRLLWVPATFDVDLRSGWCWMVSRPQSAPVGYVIGMAAEPEGDRTRFGHLEGVVGWRRALRPLLAASRLRHRRHVPRDVDGIERALGLRD